MLNYCFVSAAQGLQVNLQPLLFNNVHEYAEIKTLSLVFSELSNCSQAFNDFYGQFLFGADIHLIPNLELVIS